MISSRAMNTASLAAWSYFIEYYVKPLKSHSMRLLNAQANNNNK